MDIRLYEMAKKLAKNKGMTFMDEGNPHSRLSRTLIDPLQKRVIRKIENTVGIYEAESLVFLGLPEFMLNNPQNLADAQNDLDELKKLSESLSEDIDIDKYADKLFPISWKSRGLISPNTVIVREKSKYGPHLSYSNGLPIQLRQDPSIYEVENPLVLFFRDIPTAPEFTDMLHQILSLKKSIMMFGLEVLGDEIKKIIGGIIRQGVVFDYIMMSNEDDLYDAAHYCGVKVVERDVENIAYESFNLYDYYDYNTKIFIEKRVDLVTIRSSQVDESWKNTLIEYRDKTDSEYYKDKLDYRIKRYSGNLESLVIPNEKIYNAEYDDLMKFMAFKKLPIRTSSFKFKSSLFNKFIKELDWKDDHEILVCHFVEAMTQVIDYLKLIDRAYVLPAKSIKS